MEKEQGKDPILRLPRGREYLYIIPTAICFAITVASFFGLEKEAWYLTALKLVSCIVMTGACAAPLFVHFKVPRAVSYAVCAIAPIPAMLLLESTSHNPFEMAFNIIILNLLFFYIIAGLLLSITRRTSVSVFGISFYALLAGIAEHYVLLFRSAPLLPWDLKSIGIAATVVAGYSFKVTPSLAASVTALVFVITVGIYTGTVVEKLRKIAVRISSCVLSLALLCGYGFYLSLDRAITDFGLLDALFVPIKVYARNGFTVSFGMTLRYVSVPKPDGYSDEALSRIENELADQDSASEPYSDVEKPNIIVIMNEAFSDLSVLCDFETDKDYIPFIRSLDEDTIKGNLHVSVLGGNTANTEFEFLTGMSMAFLPAGSIPYQQYLTGETPSLASQLAANGYETLALHPYNANGWNRNEVYKWFGFERMMFKNDIPDLSLYRNYVSDISVFRHMIEELDAKDAGTPMFIFNVTMQNHGGYGTVYKNFDAHGVNVKGLEDETEISQYLSLLAETDFALRYLIDSLRAYSEPTIVVFFGDHQPASTLSEPILEMNGVSLDINDLDEREQYYKVPFFIWANYDIREETVDDISANYLSTLLCQVANIDLTDMQTFLSELRRSYPTLTANSFMTSDGRLHSSAEARDIDAFRNYSILEYNCIFGGNTTGLFEYRRRE